MATQDRWREMNHLLVSSQQLVPDVSSQEVIELPHFFRAAGLAGRQEIDPALVFVLTPFHEDQRDVFQIIADVCRDLGLKCFRGDEQFVGGDLFPHILQQIARARLVVAVVDGRNPNVFYELGLAHALDKTTILISRAINELPFDLRSKRIVLYQEPGDLRAKLQGEIARTLVAEQSPPQGVPRGRTP
jgi:hypothetical protein